MLTMQCEYALTVYLALVGGPAARRPETLRHPHNTGLTRRPLPVHSAAQCLGRTASMLKMTSSQQPMRPLTAPEARPPAQGCPLASRR